MDLFSLAEVHGSQDRSNQARSDRKGAPSRAPANCHKNKDIKSLQPTSFLSYDRASTYPTDSPRVTRNHPGHSQSMSLVSGTFSPSIQMVSFELPILFWRKLDWKIIFISLS